MGKEITCINCGWHWNTADSEEYDKYVCHKCGFDNRTFYDSEPIGENNLRDGGRTIAQTPSPKKDRIYGSKVNPKGSASSEKSASKIILSEKIIDSLKKKLSENNNDKVSLNDLKAVYRRGLGAYSSSHRPTISGGKPNSRNAWAMARVNKFLEKAAGKKVKAAYVQDDDLLKYHLGGDMTKHLAPNGKHSNLNHEQWHLVRTPEFKAWFGDWENDPKDASKVVDKNGEPLVYYQGQPYSEYPEGKYVFDKINNGIFFISNKRAALTYGVLKSVFINARNLKDIRNYYGYDNKKIPDSKRNNPSHYKQSNDEKEYVNSDANVIEFYEDVIDKYGGKLELFTYRDKVLLKNKKEIKDFIIPTSKKGFKFLNFDYKSSIWDLVAKYIKKSQYDGIICTDEDLLKDTTYDTIVVYNSSQIKLADGSNTTFDANNPDIRYEQGGTTKQYKTIASFDDSSVVIYDGNLGYKDILELTDKLPKNVQTIEFSLKDENEMESFIKWSSKEVKNEFGSEFEDGYPIIYSVEEEGQKNIKNAYGELKNGKKVVFDVEDLTWEEDKMSYADGGVTEFNKNNEVRVKEIKEDYKYDGSQKALSYVNFSVAIAYLQYLADSIGEKYYQWDWINERKEPTNHFQIDMMLEGGKILSGLFIYVDDNHKVVKSKSNVKLLDDDYNVIKVLVEENKFKSNISEYSFEYKGLKFDIIRLGNKWKFFGLHFGYFQSIPEFEAKTKNELIDRIKRYVDVIEPKQSYADGGEVTDCKEYIMQNKSLFANGYFFDMNKLSEINDPYGEVPKNLDFTLIAIDTINPTILADELSQLCNLSKSQSNIVIQYFIDNAERFNDIEQIKTEKMLIVDRDNIVCENLSYENEGDITNPCIKEVIKIIYSIQKVEDCYIEDGKLVIVFVDELMVYGIGIINYHIGEFKECHDFIEPEAIVNDKEDYKSIYFNLKKNDDTIGEYHLGGDMSKHLAPNGKPSNLTHEQWHLVRTPEFKAWFGDWENDPKNASKVVDDNGEPLVVYHGTNEFFTIFKADKPTIAVYGQGFYFTNDKNFASNYARGENSKILNLFLNARKIFYIYDDELPIGYEKFSNMADNKGLSRAFTRKIISEGYNCVYATNRYNENELVIFEPNQIKLADGTNTTFDGSNPDIRYKEGGEAKIKFKIKTDEERIEISIENIGKVVLTETTPEYEFLDDVGEKGIKKLGIYEDDIIGKIEHIQVNDKYKGQGYAKLLMKKAIEVANKKSLFPLYLNASPMGSKGLSINDLTNFYKQFGFEVFFKQGGNNLMILKSGKLKEGGEVENKETYAKWKSLVNMSSSELERFYNSEEGKKAGLTSEQAKEQGIDSGRESARWILKMKDTKVSDWTPTMWKWANKQISFISRMSGMKGSLYDDKGNKTRKHIALLIWGHNPEKKNNGGEINNHKNTNNMESFKFNGLPHIDTISDNDLILIKEEVFVGDIDKPKHKGTRYVSCKVMSKGGMVDSLNLKVIKSVGANALSVGQTITRPIANLVSNGRKMVGSFKDGGELNPDNKEVKQYFAHDSGNAGGVLVGKRHSEGGIKATNNSTGQPIEMEGGEVVITRGAVSNPKKYSFDGKEMTTREVLSKLNVDGGGVSFADGGDVPDKMKCGCNSMKLGGDIMSTQDFINMSENEYQDIRLKEGIQKEKKDHYSTLSKLNSGAITIEDAFREIAQKEMSIDSKYPFAE